MAYLVSTADLTAIQLNPENTAEAVLQNVALILATPKGTVPLYRDFGLAQDFLDRPAPAARQMMIARIREAIETWEPRATFRSVTFRDDPAQPGALLPVVEIDITLDP